MIADICRVLRKYEGKAVAYNGATYMLVGAYYKKSADNVEGVAQIFAPGTNICYEVPALDVRPTSKKWDYINKVWVNVFE